jgi:hypothetical protein
MSERLPQSVSKCLTAPATLTIWGPGIFEHANIFLGLEERQYGNAHKRAQIAQKKKRFGASGAETFGARLAPGSLSGFFRASPRGRASSGFFPRRFPFLSYHISIWPMRDHRFKTMTRTKRRAAMLRPRPPTLRGLKTRR